jgi:hypothetical protein
MFETLLLSTIASCLARSAIATCVDLSPFSFNHFPIFTNQEKSLNEKY